MEPVHNPKWSFITGYTHGCRCAGCLSTGREYHKAYQQRHPKRFNREKYDDRMAMINHAKSSGCSVCGETDIRCLDFHHKNPEEKKFSISGGSVWRKVECILEEIDKCSIICANCHRKLHYGERNSVGT
jgi:hypothetical protein